jgi:PEP-CTERM motif
MTNESGELEKKALVAQRSGAIVQSKSTFRRLALAAAASAALGLASTAMAGPTLNPLGYIPGSEGFHIVVGSPALNEDVNAGGFYGTQVGLLPGPALIDFWCFELDQFFSFGGVYTDYVAQAVTLPVGANLALEQLFTEVGGSPGATSTTPLSAAVQLAVWEIRYDPSGSYNLGAGNFQVTGGSATTIALAQTLLNNLPSVINVGYDVTLLHSESAQDFVTPTPRPPRVTPEPSSLPLLALGLGAMIFGLRRRSGNSI